MSSKITPRQRWSDAIWESDLKPLERFVALAYAKNAGNGLAGVWVAGKELRRITGLSRTGANAAIQSLKAKHWLVEVERARQHRSARYDLKIPVASILSESHLEDSSILPDGRLGSASVPPQDASVPSEDSQRSARRKRTTKGTANEPSPQPPVSDELRLLLIADGVADEDVAHVIEISQSIPDTIDARGRLLKVPSHRRSCIVRFITEQEHKRQRERDGEPRCEDHLGEPASNCSSCHGDIKAGDRPPEFMGVHFEPEDQAIA